ncbi:hypothetical protein ACKI1K_15160 [Streptomyces scabiei]|uniref:hypothetical protein n=1 Tax=Streptomyces scabiei TaxID=1930 RepID=UPI0038F61D89
MTNALLDSSESPCLAGSFLLQLHLAKHLVSEHPEEVPAAHSDGCELCTVYIAKEDEQLAAEHRARDLFMPREVARLM